jgi:hypothetical protein
MELQQSETTTRYAHDLRDGWPEQIPYLTREEAERAEKRLYRKFGRRDNGRHLLGCRYPTGGWTCVTGEPDGRSRGWRALAHDISHDLHRWLYPNKTPHGSFHSIIEREVIAYIVGSGWLDGKLKSKERAKPTVADRRQQRLANTRAKVAQWKRKLKLAQTKLKGYLADERRHELALTKPLTEPKPAAERKPRMKREPKLNERRARLWSKDLAQHFDITLDFLSDPHVPSLVYPPDHLYDGKMWIDPHEGDHTVSDWREVFGLVTEYAATILWKEQKIIGPARSK